MSANWFKDMQEMHAKYGVDKWMKTEKNPIGQGLINLCNLD